MSLTKQESEILELIMQIAKVLDTDTVCDDCLKITLQPAKEGVPH